MDLANMPSLGVRSIFTTWDYRRRAGEDVSSLPGAVAVPSLRWRLRYSARRLCSRIQVRRSLAQWR